MPILRSRLFATAAAVAVAACGGASAPTTPTVTSAGPAAPAASPPAARTDAHDALVAALPGAQRTDRERARDVYRHPVETLEFFGLTQETKVLEVSPGGGWYTAILAPVLKDKGELTVTSADPNGPPKDEGTENARAIAARFAAKPDVFGKVQTVIVGPDTPLGPDGSKDMVVVFRSVHNWVADGRLAAALGKIHRVLKPGGVLGVEAHRANPGGKTDAKTADESGYLPEAFVIQSIEAAGFKLAARSEINANPKDTKDYPRGVWTLPPSLSLKDQDRAKYVAIGESDRMTLKFVKQ